MTEDEVREIEPGLYRVTWNTVTEKSLAAVGISPEGTPWLAPTNWTHLAGKTDVWEHVASLERIDRAQAPEELAAEVRHELGMMLQRWPGSPGTHAETVVNRVPDLIESLCRLHALLGLSRTERDFMHDATTATEVHGPAAAYPILEVFADWLEDRLKPAEASAVRRLVPQRGDVLVLTYAPPEGEPSGYVRRVNEEAARPLHEFFSRRGYEVQVIGLAEGWGLEQLDMEALGLCRKTEADAAVERNSDGFRQVLGMCERSATQLRLENERLKRELALAEQSRRRPEELGTGALDGLTGPIAEALLRPLDPGGKK